MTKRLLDTDGEPDKRCSFRAQKLVVFEGPAELLSEKRRRAESLCKRLHAKCSQNEACIDEGFLSSKSILHALLTDEILDDRENGVVEVALRLLTATEWDEETLMHQMADTASVMDLLCKTNMRGLCSPDLQPSATCPVCLESFSSTSASQSCQLACGHTIHEQCLVELVLHQLKSYRNEGELPPYGCPHRVVAGLSKESQVCGVPMGNGIVREVLERCLPPDFHDLYQHLSLGVLSPKDRSAMPFQECSDCGRFIACFKSSRWPPARCRCGRTSCGQKGCSVQHAHPMLSCTVAAAWEGMLKESSNSAGSTLCSVLRRISSEIDGFESVARPVNANDLLETSSQWVSVFESLIGSFHENDLAAREAQERDANAPPDASADAHGAEGIERRRRRLRMFLDFEQMGMDQPGDPEPWIRPPPLALLEAVRRASAQRIQPNTQEAAGVAERRHKAHVALQRENQDRRLPAQRIRQLKERLELQLQAESERQPPNQDVVDRCSEFLSRRGLGVRRARQVADKIGSFLGASGEPFTEDELAETEWGTLRALLGLQDDEVEALRYVPKREQEELVSHDEAERRSAALLSEATLPCPNCGARTSKTTNSCNTTYCACGQRFCWLCRKKLRGGWHDDDHKCPSTGVDTTNIVQPSSQENENAAMQSASRKKIVDTDSVGSLRGLPRPPLLAPLPFRGRLAAADVQSTIPRELLTEQQSTEQVAVASSSNATERVEFREDQNVDVFVHTNRPVTKTESATAAAEDRSADPSSESAATSLESGDTGVDARRVVAPRRARMVRPARVDYDIAFDASADVEPPGAENVVASSSEEPGRYNAGDHIAEGRVQDIEAQGLASSSSVSTRMGENDVPTIIPALRRRLEHTMQAQQQNLQLQARLLQTRLQLEQLRGQLRETHQDMLEAVADDTGTSRRGGTKRKAAEMTADERPEVNEDSSPPQSSTQATPQGDASDRSRFDITRWQKEEQWDRDSRMRAMQHKGLEVMIRAMANLHADKARDQFFSPSAMGRFLLETFRNTRELLEVDRQEFTDVVLKRQFLSCCRQLVRLGEAYYPKLCRTKCCASLLSTLNVELDALALSAARRSVGCSEETCAEDVRRANRIMVDAKARRADAKTFRQARKDLSLPYRPLMERIEDIQYQTFAVLDSLSAACVVCGSEWSCSVVNVRNAIIEKWKEIENLIAIAEVIYPGSRYDEATSSSAFPSDSHWLEAPAFSIGCCVELTVDREELSVPLRAEISAVIRRPDVAQCPPSLAVDLRSDSQCVVLVELQQGGELRWLQASDLRPLPSCSPVVVDLQHPLSEETLNVLWQQTGNLLSMLATAVEDFLD